MKYSKEKFPPLNIGTTVRVTIPDVNRARGCPRNLLPIVARVKNNYKNYVSRN